MTITTTRDQVRLLIGDTDSTRPILFDDELDLFLTQRADNVLLAAADACDAAAAKFARDYDFKWKDGTFNRSQMVKYYSDLATTLRTRAAQTDETGLPLWCFPPAPCPLDF